MGMSRNEIQSLATAWIEQCRSRRQEWTTEMELIDDAVRNRPDEAWELILELIMQSPDEHVLSNIAAGPLEDLLSLHGDAIIDRVELGAERNLQFRRCLQMVWGENRISRPVFERLVRASRDG